MKFSLMARPFEILCRKHFFEPVLRVGDIAVDAVPPEKKLNSGQLHIHSELPDFLNKENG